MQQIIGNVTRIIFMLFAVLFSLFVIVDATSRVVQKFDAKAAITINPFNSHARLKYVTQNIGKADDITKLNVLKNTLEKGLEVDPSEARFYSLYGMIIEAEGDVDAAQNYYNLALSLIPTEGYALIRKIAYSARKNDFPEAVKLADLVFQRWKTRWPLVEPLLPIILQDDDAYQLALEDFTKREGGKEALVTGLIKSSQGLTLASQLLLDLNKAGFNDLEWVTASTIRRMITAGRGADAYRLFVLTLDESRKQDLGYVFNGAFSQEPKFNNPFDWSFSVQSGVNIAINNRKLDGQQVKAVELKFLDKPTNLTTLRQTIRLPENSFRFNVKYSSDVKGPKPLILSIACLSTQQEVTQLILEPTNGDVQTISSEFKIPPTGCDLQFISLYNKNFSKSWQNRYSGNLNLYNIAIELAGR
ncbi:MAG: hypothetical protein ABJN78_08080 [Hyphomicrobiales bacterium]